MADTYWCCMFCGAECGSAEPATFMCCGEIGHTEERDEETGEAVGTYEGRSFEDFIEAHLHAYGEQP